MCTHHSVKDERCTVDLGAQYISTEPQNYASHQESVSATFCSEIDD